MKEFEQLNLRQDLVDFLKSEGLSAPTEVQAKVFPEILAGESLSVLAQTGSGKTLAYALPVVQQLKEREGSMEDRVASPRALVITPTRELSGQVFKVFKNISHFAKLRVRQLAGGDKGKRTQSLKTQSYDILVGGPGRIASAIKSGEIKTDALEFFVLDEADQLLDMGFKKDLVNIHKALRNSELQVGLFSATHPDDYKRFISEILPARKLKDLHLAGAHMMQQNIETFNIHLGAREKVPMTELFLKKQGKGKGIIFVNRKEDVEKLSKTLSEEFPHRKFWNLSGGMSKKDRETSYAGFLEKGGVLIASDIVARGLDIQELGWVLNYDLPFEAVYYIHRAGRTGRHGTKGQVYNFVTAADSNLIARINTAIQSQSSLKLESVEPVKTRAKKSGTKKKVVAKKKKTVRKKAKRSPGYKRR